MMRHSSSRISGMHQAEWHGGISVLSAGGHSNGTQTLYSRREKLQGRQEAWRRDIEEDAHLREFLDLDLLDLDHPPTPLELNVLYKSLVTPGVHEDDQRASTHQLIQLLHSTEHHIRLYALEGLVQRIEADDVEEYQLTSAVKPLVHILLEYAGIEAPQDPVYWGVMRVLQQLCLDEQHAMTVSDVGGTQALVALLDCSQQPTPMFESINYTVLNNLLNAIWLICCYEGDGDLGSYDEAGGPVVSLLRLLEQLRSADHIRLTGSRKNLKDTFFMSDHPEHRQDEEAQADPILVVLKTFLKLSKLRAYRGQITGAGGIEQCVPLLKGAAENVAHRIHAARIIQNLMVDNSLEFVVLGGVPHTLHMLASPIEDEHAVALSLGLHLFSIRGDVTSLAADMVSGGGLAVCCELIQSESLTTCRRALKLLAYLCRYGPEDYSYLITQEEGSIEALVYMLKDDQLGVIQDASALLWYVSEVETCHQRLVHCGGVPLMAKLLHTLTDRVVGHNLAGCLKRLECFDDLNEDIFDAKDASQPAIEW